MGEREVRCLLPKTFGFKSNGNECGQMPARACGWLGYRPCPLTTNQTNLVCELVVPVMGREKSVFAFKIPLFRSNDSGEVAVEVLRPPTTGSTTTTSSRKRENDDEGTVKRLR
ncbi:Os01g0272901 [Oryza sativa Japonica Group]|uniref:Os01g0272901 protein n=1 Tax=Oryza sativa subsp. japonica TaxID=39947 RepID=A0A0P0V181_ORYSJ|nr:hypothetical protein EE612_001716 [Oryza sativa]BAS71516.1 Os01g0272901 [Oryza sativa Japonica Group]